MSKANADAICQTVTDALDQCIGDFAKRILSERPDGLLGSASDLRALARMIEHRANLADYARNTSSAALRR